jgi:hypothetical protein
LKKGGNKGKNKKKKYSSSEIYSNEYDDESGSEYYD